MKFEPYRDADKPGRKDINGVEWWACDPYPTWFRWEDGADEPRVDHAAWAAEDPHIELQRALKAEAEAEAKAEAMLSSAHDRVRRAREAADD
jgi:hypothetical protein